MNPDTVRQQVANLRQLHPELVEDEEAWLLSLESETDLTELLRAIERKRQETEGLAVGIDHTINGMKVRRERFVRREQAMRDIAFKLMQAADLKKKELPEATLSVTNGKSKVIVTDEDVLPNVCYELKRVPLKNRIKEFIDVVGHCPGATLSNAEPHLTIRTK